MITNIGATPAYDLLITFDPPPERTREDVPQFKLKDARILNERTPMVAPSREFRMFFDSAPERYASKLSMTFKVTTEYRDSRDARYIETATLDFDIRRGGMYTQVKSLHDGVQPWRRSQEHSSMTDHRHRSLLRAAGMRLDHV